MLITNNKTMFMVCSFSLCKFDSMFDFSLRFIDILYFSVGGQFSFSLGLLFNWKNPFFVSSQCERLNMSPYAYSWSWLLPAFGLNKMMHLGAKRKENRTRWMKGGNALNTFSHPQLGLMLWWWWWLSDESRCHKLLHLIRMLWWCGEEIILRKKGVSCGVDDVGGGGDGGQW